MRHAMISIKPCYVEMLISGIKTVELRKKNIHLPPESRLWIYSTRPEASVQAVLKVKRVDLGSPAAIWRRHEQSTGVSKDRFDSYAAGATSVSAIIVDRIWKLPVDISLERLREMVPGFHPPQFLKYMAESDPLLSAIIGVLIKKSGVDFIQKAGLDGNLVLDTIFRLA